MKLLPPKLGGNSMLEFKDALVSLGFGVEAQKLTIDELANIRVPSVVLILPPKKLQGTGALPLGHYLVLWPLDEEKVRVLDYPHDPFVLSVDYLVRHLRDASITNIPVLLCSKQGQEN